MGKAWHLSETPRLSREGVLCTWQALSNGCSQNKDHPEFGHIFACPHPIPTMASGGLLPCAPVSLPMTSLASQLHLPPAPWQAGGLDACPLSPALLLAQVSKLEVGLVALKAEGQGLLLELEKNQ